MNKVEICGIDTGKLPHLNSSESSALFAEVKNNIPGARDRLIYCNLRLVLSVVHRFMCRGDPDDLFQVGCIGLIKAIDNFNDTLGVCFSTYAVPMIIGEIRRYLRDNNPVRVSRSLRDTAYKALQAAQKLSALKTCEPTAEDIAAELGITPAEVRTALAATQEPVSIYEPVYHDGADAVFMIDQLGDDRHPASEWSESLALREAVASLEDREKSIVCMRYFSGKTQMEIADDIGISQAQVSRLEKTALERIKKLIK